MLDLLVNFLYYYVISAKYERNSAETQKKVTKEDVTKEFLQKKAIQKSAKQKIF